MELTSYFAVIKYIDLLTNDSATVVDIMEFLRKEDKAMKEEEVISNEELAEMKAKIDNAKDKLTALVNELVNDVLKLTESMQKDVKKLTEPMQKEEKQLHDFVIITKKDCIEMKAEKFYVESGRLIFMNCKKATEDKLTYYIFPEGSWSKVVTGTEGTTLCEVYE